MMIPMRYFPVPKPPASRAAIAAAARDEAPVVPVGSRPLDLGHLHLRIYAELQPAASLELAQPALDAGRQ
jgi:hypothetical protein